VKAYPDVMLSHPMANIRHACPSASHFVHEIAVSICRSHHQSWWGLVLAKNASCAVGDLHDI